MKTNLCKTTCLIQNICSELCDPAKEEIKKDWKKYEKLWLKEKGLTKKEMIRYEDMMSDLSVIAAGEKMTRNSRSESDQG